MYLDRVLLDRCQVPSLDRPDDWPDDAHAKDAAHLGNKSVGDE